MRISDWSSDVCSSDLDQEGGPFDAHVFAAIEALFHPHAIGLQHPSFGIAAEHHLQAMLAGELLMALDAVLGDAEHGGSRGGEFLAQRSEIERFFRASGGIVLGIEITEDRKSGV